MTETLSPRAQTDERAAAHLKRNTLGGVVGNVLEWYDFAVFGYFAPIIGAQFFPSDNPLASLLNAFGVFAAGYLMRPLGGRELVSSLGDESEERETRKSQEKSLA